MSTQVAAQFFWSGILTEEVVTNDVYRGPLQSNNALEVVTRFSTDALGPTTLTLQNVRLNSQYWIATTSGLTVLATGTQGGVFTDIVIPNLSYYASPTQITIRIRLANYIPFETNAFLTKNSVSSYVIQTFDSVF